MISIGIELSKGRAICFVLEKDSTGNFQNLTSKKKYFEIKDDRDDHQIQTFFSEVHDYFNVIKPNVIGIITRQTKGKFAASPISFKLEGLIQCYPKQQIAFISKQTLSAFYKKHAFSASFDHSYQENAAKLSYYLLEK